MLYDSKWTAFVYSAQRAHLHAFPHLYTYHHTSTHTSTHASPQVAQLTVDLKDAGDRYSQLQGRLADTETLLTTTQMHAEGMQGQIQQLQVCVGVFV